jgi:trk system potassium uptake protein TrkH
LFILYGIYIGLTLLEFSILLIGGLTPFESLTLSLGTAGTGGFSILNSGLSTYSSFVQWTIAIFMFLFGVNFNIYFLILMNDVKSAFKSEELRAYILLYIFSVIFIVANTFHLFSSFGEALRHGAFHVSSLMTSTGYSIGNINVYPTSCRILCLCLMLISACAGSTCGGFKISRLLICIKSIKRDILKTFHPNSVRTITFEGKKVEETTVKSTTTFLFLYIGIIVILMFLISFDGLSLNQTINAVFTTFGNVGLCFDISNFADFSNFSKFILSIGMLFGRLEIFPIIVWASSLRK